MHFVAAESKRVNAMLDARRACPQSFAKQHRGGRCTHTLDLSSSMLRS